MSDTKTIAVVGAGMMGHGIALTFAQAGHAVRAFDPMEATRAGLRERVSNSVRALGGTDADAEAVNARITISETLAACLADADLMFEAAPEKPALKQQIFKDAEAAAPAHCLLASNTSVIPITKIVTNLTDKSRALGTHWWNPPHFIPLVEVIRTEWTTEAAMDAMTTLLQSVGKTAVRVDKDVPGFIGNRLQHALWREAISLVEHGICSAEAVDTVVKLSFGRRLAVIGPLQSADLVGTDLSLDVQENVVADLERRAEPSAYLRNLVETGKLGMKSGEGFHKWTPESAAALRAAVESHLKKANETDGSA